jgi:hypothetical protein
VGGSLTPTPPPSMHTEGGGTEPNSPTEVVQQAACENQLPRTAHSAPIAAMNNRCGIFWRIHNYFSKRQIYWRGNVAENLLFMTAHNSEKENNLEFRSYLSSMFVKSLLKKKSEKNWCTVELPSPQIRLQSSFSCCLRKRDVQRTLAALPGKLVTSLP